MNLERTISLATIAALLAYCFFLQECRRPDCPAPEPVLKYIDTGRVVYRPVPVETRPAPQPVRVQRDTVRLYVPAPAETSPAPLPRPIAAATDCPPCAADSIRLYRESFAVDSAAGLSVRVESSVRGVLDWQRIHVLGQVPVPAAPDPAARSRLYLEGFYGGGRLTGTGAGVGVLYAPPSGLGGGVRYDLLRKELILSVSLPVLSWEGR